MYVRTVVQASALDEVRGRASAMRRNDEALRILASTFMFTLQAEAPRDTGWMAKSMATIERTPNGYGVAPYSKIGAPSRSAPRGTIRKFLEDYPQYRGRTRAFTRSGRPLKRLRRRPFKNAWHFLPAEAKRKLAALRRAGMYGMNGPSPRYWQAISEIRVPTASGAMTGDDFIRIAYRAAHAMSKIMARNVFGTAVKVT